MIQIGVVGASQCDQETYETAYKIGQLIAENNCILINGGLGGVMEASAKGAKSKGGTVVGILPVSEKKSANAYVDVVIATNMGHARNIIIVHSSDAIIAIGGGYGTLSEIAIALKEGKKVIGLKTKFNVPGLEIACSENDAIKKVLEGCM